VHDAEETGADVLVSCCPFCALNLSQAAKKIGSPIKVMDLSQVLLEVTAPKPEEPAADKA
jgi:Fe-S oxidoreductase